MKKGPIFGAPNFTYEEFLRSDTALREGIQNIPDKDCVWCNMEYLAREILQPVRDKFGPIRVTSGYRSAALNKVIPGSSATSHHCSGSAADIEPVRKDVSLRDIFSFIATDAGLLLYIKAGERCVEAAFVQVLEQGRQQWHVPIAADFIQCHIESFFLLLIDVQHHAVHFGVSEILQHLEPLVAADDNTGSLIPDDRLHVSEFFYAAAQLFKFGITGLQVLARIVLRWFELVDADLFNIHTKPHSAKRSNPPTCRM